MIPQLIATDLDGTFLDGQGQYPVAAFDRLLERCRELNIRMVIATGDPYDHVLDLFGGLTNRRQLTFVVEDGALIVAGTGEILSMSPLPQLAWRAAVAWLQTSSLMGNNYLIACARDRAYTELAVASERFRASQAFYPKLTSVSELAAVTDDILKLDVTWKRSDIQAQVKAFNRQFVGDLWATSSGLGGMNVSLPGVSKASALTSLGREWGISTAKMAAFGDSGNDQAMLQFVGQGFVVENGDPDLLARIPHHLGRHDDGVVLKQMQRWIDEAR
ncbi:HAD superfamily hydrolase [Levilactobacillus senmaizukei DSM 21775 = NBRC 103853]|uniref:HAD superfamily hydrolase n=1 Tax=Levilactobacillus senmaizukei DSM 21775 = NBRC 103853 TaxID=1423803 RepID=A0A0R2DH98_9LACO|nr:HAD-IIB family hydrolase [Levilactobacillus senmaizukei]KRN03406.1 HAD superfamily hydrolase [Levilactobacillus senmaizukei DSM 21775 = NBRC 103853]